MWRCEKQITSDDGKWRVDFLIHSDGRVRFEEFKMLDAWEDDGVEYEGYWVSGPISGYYGCLADAEVAAKTEVQWLRDATSRKHGCE